MNNIINESVNINLEPNKIQYEDHADMIPINDTHKAANQTNVEQNGNIVFSVILPTYNRSYCISDAIDSILNQTFNSYEIIVIDDGSKDDTKEVLEKYNKKIKYLYQNNNGVSAARNFGISKSTGKYLAFIDSDDLWTKEHLENHYNFLEKNIEYALSYNYAKVIDFKTGKSSGHFSHKKSNHIIKYPETIFINNNILTTPSIVIRKSIIDEIGVFDEGMDMCEDLDLWRRISKMYKIKCIPQYLTIIRERENQFDPTIFFSKRKLFLEKAILEDIYLDRSTIISLYYELYSNYYKCGCDRNVIMANICSSVKEYPELISIIANFENNHDISLNPNFNVRTEKEAQLYSSINILLHFKINRIIVLNILLPLLVLTIKTLKKIKNFF